MHFAGEISTLGVMVEPATYRLLFGAAMSDLVDHVYDAAALLGSARARHLHAEMERYRQQPAALAAAKLPAATNQITVYYSQGAEARALALRARWKRRWRSSRRSCTSAPPSTWLS